MSVIWSCSLLPTAEVPSGSSLRSAIPPSIRRGSRADTPERIASSAHGRLVHSRSFTRTPRSTRYLPNINLALFDRSFDIYRRRVFSITALSSPCYFQDVLVRPAYPSTWGSETNVFCLDDLDCESYAGWHACET